jgi:hypothetical protein
LFTLPAAGSGAGGYGEGPLRLRDWVTSGAGESAAAGLISVLISEHLSATGALARCLGIYDVL